MIENKEEKERVLLVAVETPENHYSFQSSIEELANLVDTAQGEVVGQLLQNREKVDGRTMIGKGKVDELIALIDETEADLVVFNNELGPRQNQNLSDILGVKVIDRVQLILDIFAMRASTREGFLQVELAQLRYLMPRLSGMGASLSRLGAGIGSRGPGESKLESDRRVIRHRIDIIKANLKENEKHRKLIRKDRLSSGVIKIGLVGYTNAGKSTTLNLMSDAHAYEEDQLFATLDPLTKSFQLPSGLKVTLTDTVGFIQDLPHQLIEAFKSTLEEVAEMDLLLHVVDASDENHHLHERVVDEILAEINADKIPTLVVYNKADLASSDFVRTKKDSILISAKDPASKELLGEYIEDTLKFLLEEFVVHLPIYEQYKIDGIKKDNLIFSEEFDEEKMEYTLKGYRKK
ncbi:MAG: GTPase HflX [Lactobacillales bacterium]|jgi:GTP-binding protein HflX|nr:GTPase HflX [Lactobacillales bacterium]